MAVISDIAGTTLNSFSINDKVTLFYSDNEPDENLGNLGDFCFTNNGNLYAKKIFKGNHDDENDDENNELINIPKWMKITDKVLPSAKGSKELVFDDIDINDEAAYNTTKNIIYDKTDNHLHDDIVIQSEITDDSSTILPNIGYLNKNFVHNKGNETIQDEKTFENLKSNQQIPSNSNDKTVPTTNWVTEKILSIIDNIYYIGDIKPSLQSSNHGNWLLCNGQEVSRSDYSELFNLIGTNFGSGDGVNTFNVPDYRGKFLRGLGGDSASDIYTTQAEGIPNHTHATGRQGTNNSGRFIWNSDNEDYVLGTKAGSIYWNGSQDSHDTQTYTAGSSVNESLGYADTNSTSLAKTDNLASDGVFGASNHVTPINQAVNYFIKAKKE